MKKVIILLLTVAVVVSLIFAGCMPGAPPPVTPPPVTPPPVTPPPVAPPVTPPPAAPLLAKDVPGLQQQIADGSVDPNLLMNPYEGLAVKPDGTPFKFWYTVNFMACEWTINSEGLMHSLLVNRAGAEYSFFDSELDDLKQIFAVEDVVATGVDDAIIILPVDESLMGPSLDRALQAGIPVFSFDRAIPSAGQTSVSYHNFVMPGGGSDVCGQWFVQKAEELDKPMKVFELWGSYGVPTLVDRHVGFADGIAGSLLVTEVESADTDLKADLYTSFVMDAFTAEPELNGLFVQGGPIDAAIAGLRAIDRLVPPDDPNHVYVCLNDIDGIILSGIEEGTIDATGTHGPYDLVDVAVKLALLNVVCGKPVPPVCIMPIYVVDASNYKTQRMLGGPAAWPVMPFEEWDLWPVLDSTSGMYDANFNVIPGGVPTPTVEMRKQTMGY